MVKPMADPGRQIDDPAGLGACDAIEALRGGELTSVALVTALLARRDERADLGAFYYLDPDAALRAGEQADAARARGDDRALLGLPLAVKDNINTAGIPTTAGTPLLREHRPKRNAPVLQRLLDAGAFVLGKTSMHELAFGITGNNTEWGPARNPHDPRCIPGGSSGGTAIAVSTGMAPAGLGSDTGGSVRIPAALCGVTGLRPSTGRYPAAGVVPISSTRDTVGPIARSVADLALIDEVLTGSAPLGPPPALQRLRLGLPDGFFLDDLDAEVAELMASAFGRLREAGVELVDVKVENMADLYAAAGFPITLYEAVVTLEAYFREEGLPYRFVNAAESAASPDVKKILCALAGDEAIDPDTYQAAIMRHRPALQTLCGSIFAGAGISGVVFPMTPLPAVLIGKDTIEINGKVLPTFETFIHNSGPGSVAGLPGLTLPCGRTKTGLPVGFAIDGPAFSDRHLLAVGRALESVVAPPGGA